MKAKKKNLLIYGLIAALFLELFIIPAPEVQAGGDGVLKNGGKITLVNTARDRKQGYWLSLSGIPENDSWENYKVKVTSSKKSVAAVKEVGGYYAIIKPKKTGTTKMTVVYTKKGTKKKIKQTATVKIVNFKQPFKSLKVDGKNCIKKVKSTHNRVTIKTSKSTGKIKYKLNPGWKLAFGAKNGTSYKIDGTGSCAEMIQLRNKKTGVWIDVLIEVKQ